MFRCLPPAGNKITLQVNGYDPDTTISLALEIKQRLLNMANISDVIIHQSNPKREMRPV